MVARPASKIRRRIALLTEGRAATLSDVRAARKRALLLSHGGRRAEEVVRTGPASTSTTYHRPARRSGRGRERGDAQDDGAGDRTRLRACRAGGAVAVRSGRCGRAV